MRKPVAILAAVAALTLSGCPSDAEPTAETTLADLRAAIDRGDGCAELIDIKNRMDPKSSDYLAAPDLLRSVGCFSATATRTD